MSTLCAVQPKNFQASLFLKPTKTDFPNTVRHKAIVLLISQK